jgi:hypothetical protein
MVKKTLCLLLLLGGRAVCAQTSDYINVSCGELLPGSTNKVGLWFASSGWKISRDKPLPKAKGQAIEICAARNEAEAAQLVVRPTVSLNGFTVRTEALTGPGAAVIPAKNIEVLKVRYVNVTRPTDKSSVAGLWPDPLPPLKGSINLEANKNHPFWIRVKIPRNVSAGKYTGNIKLSGQNLEANVTLSIEVYDFVLPDRMTCTTAFGFSPGNVFRYQKISSEKHKRQVLEKYWDSFSTHHISPYNPAPLDGIKVTWPNVKPPVENKYANWEGLRIVDNEAHSGTGSLLIYDDDQKSNVTVSYKPLIEIPAGGIQARLWYRTAVPDHRFGIALNHYDKDGKWMSGRNNDMTLKGNGRWQLFEALVRDFPKGAKFIRPMVRATTWTDAGELTGLVWFDEVSLKDAASGKELVEGGNFDIEKRTELVAPAEQLKVSFDFLAWDKAMEKAINHYHFNSFDSRTVASGL